MPSTKKSPGYTAIRELLKQFPDAPALTLAKRAYRESPELWSNINACRQAVRFQLGSIGKNHRDKSDKTFHRQPRKAGGDWSKAIPAALSHFDDWGAVQVAGPMRALILSDVHIPYHSVEAVKVAINHGIDQKANTVILNGDMFDFFGLSRWEKDPRKRNFPAEVRAGRQFLKAIREAFPKAAIYFKEGNHEERWEKYLQLKAPELLGLPEFDWQEVYGLESLNITRVGECRPLKLGTLNVIHGHEYRFAISNPVNPARGLFLRGKVHALCGHFHASSQHSEKNLEQHVTSTWSTGCLCEMHPDYAPLNNWGQGFAFVDVNASGAFQVSNLRIIEGKCY